MFFRHVLGCLLILAASVVPILGQGRPTARSTFNIAGNVRDDSDQHTMENVRVDLKSIAGVPVNTTFTRGNGEFEFANLSNGEYVISIEVKDYEPFQQQISIFNTSRRGISIFLARPIIQSRSKSSGSISAHQLSAPHKARDEFDKGMDLMYGKSDFQGAITQFQRAIKDFSTYYEAYSEEGNAYLQLRQMAPAEEAMRKSVDLSSGQFAEGLFMLAGLLNDTNRFAEAETIAQQGMERDAGSWHGPFELARAYSGLKRPEDAEKSALQARDMNPAYPPTYLMLANIHIQHRDYQGLLKDLDAYLKLVPTGPQADQARAARDDLQAAMKKAETQAKAQPEQKPDPVKDMPRTNSSAPETQQKMPPPPDPDSSGLPSLPPPVPENQ